MTMRISAALLGLASLAAPLEAQTEWTSSRPDGHAPIGVMADHVHEKGEFMFSYRYMRMDMDGSQVGTDDVADSDIVSATGTFGFMVTPTQMPMNMHMLGIMYAPSDRVTLMGMFNYLDNSMDHITRPGGAFTTESSGFGDVGVTAMVGLLQEGSSRVHLNLGATFPTGSIEAMDVLPASAPNEVQLPYPMQLGSGTVALAPGLTFLGMAERTSYGIQGKGTFQLGDNDRAYTLGNRLEATGWLAFRAADRLSVSVRGKYQDWDDIEGADAALNPAAVPTARADLRGGKRFDIPVGLNYWFNSGALSGLRILAEYDIPLWQDLNGPQLKSTGVLTVGLQLSVDPN